jgi:hypothetical protein
MKEQIEKYTAEQIKILEGLAAVRKRLRCTLETPQWKVFTTWFMN